MPKWKRLYFKLLTKFVSRMMLLAGAGMPYYKLERPNVDWKKYLGPDWKPSYESPSTVIANHSSWIDICLMTILKFPSFTPKIGIKKWPVFGPVSDIVFNSYFINRAGTPEERHQIVLDIVER